jgi:hypothetical protein
LRLTFKALAPHLPYGCLKSCQPKVNEWLQVCDNPLHTQKSLLL